MELVGRWDIEQLFLSFGPTREIFYALSISWADPEGGQGVRTPPPPPPPPPLNNHQNIGLLSNTGPDTLKNHKATNHIQFWAIIGPAAKPH